MSEPIVPGAVTVAVTSGKGGVGKSTTAAALALALAARVLDVVLLDADVTSANAHLIADVTDPTVGVDREKLELQLPASPHGFRVVTPVSVTAAQPRAREVAVSDLVGMVRFARPPQVVVVDLPPGWTSAHGAICGTLPDLIITVAAPTEPSLVDHAAHRATWVKEWHRSVRARKERDRRRKVDLPDNPTMVGVETMARFTGIPDGGTTPVTVRRLDAVAAERVAQVLDPVVSIPATATLTDAAASPEVAKLADLVTELLPA